MSRKYKRHRYDDRLKYMRMMEDGYSSKYIHTHFGISHELLKALWLMYQEKGPAALAKKQYVKSDGAFKERVVRDIEKNPLPLHEATIKYNVSVSSLLAWQRIVREYGYEALYQQKRRGRPPKDKDMGRPRKKKPEEMTELERLRYENECLRTENALLKKLRALVEEREARMREIGRKPSKN